MARKIQRQRAFNHVAFDLRGPSPIEVRHGLEALNAAEAQPLAIDPAPEAWVFPSEKLSTPLRKDNCWRLGFLPRLKPIGLAWVNFQVMRRTHSCLMKELDVDPQVRAEQMGHTVDVNENVYTRTSLQRRREAVNKLEAALTIN